MQGTHTTALVSHVLAPAPPKTHPLFSLTQNVGPGWSPQGAGLLAAIIAVVVIAWFLTRALGRD